MHFILEYKWLHPMRRCETYSILEIGKHHIAKKVHRMMPTR